jgi:hypothetical protein
MVASEHELGLDAEVQVEAVAHAHLRARSLPFTGAHTHPNEKVMRTNALSPLLLLLACVVLVGCDTTDRAADTGPGTDQVQPLPEPDPLQDPADELELEVDIAARELHVRRGGRISETHPVAVGSDEWPTRTGEFTIDQVVLNPRWVPPDEEWAEDEEEVEAGDPENPLGVAQLVYDRPRSIHGTNEPGSIGQAVSHGSIRVSNDVARDLARQVMEAAGVEDADRRLQRAEQNPDQSQSIQLPRGIPVRVMEGSG